MLLLRIHRFSIHSTRLRSEGTGAGGGVGGGVGCGGGDWYIGGPYIGPPAGLEPIPPFSYCPVIVLKDMLNLNFLFKITGTLCIKRY